MFKIIIFLKKRFKCYLTLFFYAIFSKLPYSFYVSVSSILIIGGVGTSFAMNIVVFKETQSTLLSGIYTALTLFPNLVLPLIIGPLIDRFSRKKIIVGLDFLGGMFFLLCAFLTRNNYFNYPLFITMGLLMNANGIIYNTAYDALFPELIPKGMYQKGYAIGSMIYPLASTLFTPLAALCFEHFGTSFLFLTQGSLLLIAATFECFIQINESLNNASFTKLRDYFGDLKEGMKYLRSERGLCAIYLYFFFAMFCSQGFATILVPFFETHPILSITSYSLLLSSETVGRFLSGFLHYSFKIPSHKKYRIATTVYLIYEVGEGLLMFTAFPLMLVIRFILGFLGTNSANIRMSTTGSYIPVDKRGRVNSISSLLSFAGIVCGSLVSGVLGEYFPYPYIGILYSFIGVMAVYFIIIKNKGDVKKIYNREI